MTGRLVLVEKAAADMGEDSLTLEAVLDALDDEIADPDVAAAIGRQIDEETVDEAIEWARSQ